MPPRSGRQKTLHLAIESTTEFAIAALDRAGAVQAWSRGADAITGFTESEVLGRYFDFLFTEEDRAAGVPAGELATALASGRAEDRRWQLRRDGKRFYADGVTVPMRDDAGEHVGFTKLFRDATSRHLSERRLHAQLALMRLFQESEEVEVTTRRMMQVICEVLGWDYGELWAVEPDGGAIRCEDSWAAPGFEELAERFCRGWRFASGEGLPGRVWATGRGEWIGDLQRDPNFPRAGEARRFGLRSGIAFPILRGGAVTGVLEFFSRRGEPLDPDQLAILASMGVQVGEYIERRRILAALRESEARYRVITESARDAIFTMDAESTILFVNPAVETLLGWKPEDLVGRKLDVIIPERLRAAHHEGVQRYIRTGAKRISWEGTELPALHRDGSEVPMEISFGEWRADGRRIFSGFARDIRERKRIDSEMRALLEREQQARAEAERAVAVRERTLGVVSHDLRNPLTKISLAAELLGTLELGDAAEQVELIRASATQMERLILDLLDAATIERSGVTLRRERVRLAQLIDQACSSNRVIARQRGQEIECRLEPDLPEVAADPHRILQVLNNLVGNAIKFSPEGGRIGIVAERAEGEVVISVDDCGPGLPEGAAGRIFDTQWQAPETAHLGAGLGLSIVRSIVEAHGGSVRAENREEGGARFSFTLPLDAG